eukprot:s194_g45.t1
MALRTAISTHLILDLQDVAWYMSQVNFKTPQVKSFFSKHDHFEYSQIAVQQDVQNEEALVTGDCWQVDPLRRELIRHHRDKRQYLHEMTRSPAPPIPKDQLLDGRETHIEYQDGKKVLHKDNWKAEKKRLSDNLDGYWKGKTIYKIKDGYEIPDDVVKTDIERNAKKLRGNQNMPEDDPLDDDIQPGYPTGQDPDDDDDPNEEYIIPNDDGPPPEDDMDMPGVIQDSGETPDEWFPPQQLSDPDVPIEEIVAPDDDDSPGNDPTSEPIRVRRKQREFAVDSSGALPKAKAKVIIKRPTVQLPGHVQPIEVPVPKDDFSEEDEEPFHDPQASSSNDPSIPLPTTTPTSFMPGEYAELLNFKKKMLTLNHISQIILTLLILMATEPAPVTFYGVGSPEGEAARDESSDTAGEVQKSLLVEERLFSACYQQPRTWKQRKEYKEQKVEDCAWTPVVDENMLKFLESFEHKPGWYPFENGHAQVAYRAKALRTPDPYYDKMKFHLRTSIVKRRGVWWLLEMIHGMNKENIPASLEEEAEVLVSVFLPSERTYLAATPQLTPEIVEELLEHFMDPVNGSAGKGRDAIHFMYENDGSPGYINKVSGTTFPRSYRKTTFYVLLPSFFDVAQVFLTSNGVVLVYENVPPQCLKRCDQLPTLALNVLHPGGGHQLPSSVTGGTWTSTTPFEHVAKEKGLSFVPGGGIPTTCRTTAWEFMGQTVPRNYGMLVFATALPLKEHFDPTSESIHGLCAEEGGSGEPEEPETDPTAGGSGEAEEPEGEGSAVPEESQQTVEGEACPAEAWEAPNFWVEYDEDQEMQVAAEQWEAEDYQGDDPILVAATTSFSVSKP